MRKLLWTISGLWLCGLLAAAGAESFALADGKTISGDVISFNDNGIIFRTSDDKYTDRLPWIKFSQDGLKQLAQKPKMQPFVEPFIEPPQVERAPKPEVKIQDVPRLDRSSPASLFGGLFSSSVGLLALLLIYAANLYAAYEIALFRARPLAQVVGVSAALPIAGPIIFVSLPGLRVAEPPVGEKPAETSADGTPVENEPHRFAVPGMKQEGEEIHIVTGSWEAGAPPPPAPSEANTEIFQRGQFMFNRRFFETKFSGFFGIVRREADKDKVLQVKTPHALFVAERITRITANDVYFEVLRGDSRQEVMVPFAEIQEVQLKHKNT
ncbi:MAG: hypothetical protein ABSE90_07915 [Verrucomicrobiota bacterium]